MKKLAFLGGAGALGLAALFGAPIVQAADHLDAPGIEANPMADINDVFAWTTSDAAKVNLALTVSPGDDGTRHFGPSIQYVFHVTQHPAFLQPGTETKIICTFLNDTSGQCWVVDPDGKTIDYVAGDLSNTVGKLSDSGKFRVFAGRRSDPFFFNFIGFKMAVAAVKALPMSTLNPDAQGCPQITKALGDMVRAAIQTESTTAIAPCAANQADCFLNFNVKAIVIQIDKDELVSPANKLISVWAATHAVQ